MFRKGLRHLALGTGVATALVGASLLSVYSQEVVTDFDELVPTSVSYENDTLVIDYDDMEFEVLSATIETGYRQNVALITPGVSKTYAINLATGADPVNIFGTYRDLNTQEIKQFFTRVWDPQCRFTFPPTDPACNIWGLPMLGSCEHTETADCGDQGHVTVECSGDRDCSGSHTDGENGEARCRSTTVTEKQIGPYETIKETSTKERVKKCPPPPPEPDE